MIRAVDKNVQVPGLRRAPLAAPVEENNPPDLEHAKVLKEWEQAQKDLDEEQKQRRRLEELHQNQNALVTKLQQTCTQHEIRANDLASKLAELESKLSATAAPSVGAPMVITRIAVTDVDQSADLSEGAVLTTCTLTSGGGEQQVVGLPLILSLDIARKLLRKLKEG